jgi:O-antigen ligase
MMTRLAFWFWFATWTKGAITYLFFQDEPVLGTLAGGSISLFFAVAIAITWLAQPGRLPSRVPQVGWLIVFYLIWAGITILWSGSRSPVSAIGYWAVLALDLLVVFTLLQEQQANRIVKASLQGIIFGAVFLALFASLGAGVTADERLGHEVFLHPNYLGNQIAIASICCIPFATGRVHRTRTILWLFAFAGLVFALLQSLSKTSIVAFAAAFLFFMFRMEAPKRVRAWLVCLILLVGFLSRDAILLYAESYIEQGRGQALATLTGRTLIWAETVDLIAIHPVRGQGFLSFRDVFPQFADLRLEHAHNEWLQQWYALGLLGLALSLWIYVCFFRLLWRAGKQGIKNTSTLGMALLAYALVRGMTEASATDLVFPIILLAFFVLWVDKAVERTNLVPGSPARVVHAQ